MKQPILILLSILFITACNQNHNDSENQSTDSNPAVITYYEKPDLSIIDFYSGDQRNRIEYNFIDIRFSVNNKIDLFRFSPKQKPNMIGTIIPNQEINIIARKENTNLGPMYLVSIQNSGEYWAGWILEGEIPDAISRSVLESKFSSIPFEMTPDNEMIILKPSYFDDIQIIDKVGSLQAVIPLAEMPRYLYNNRETVTAPIFIGWDNANEYLWIRGNVDAVTVYFGRISNTNYTFETFRTASDAETALNILNKESGTVWYSDYPRNLTGEEKDRIARSNQVFRLYSYNLFTQERIVLSENIGEGFNFIKDENGNWDFEISDNYE